MALRIANLSCPPQIGTEWCWAAITQGILTFYDNPKDQFEIVCRFLNFPFCGGGSAVIDDCNHPKSLGMCLDRNGVPSNETLADTVSISNIQQHLADHKPVCLRIEFTDHIDPDTHLPRAHFLLVCGFTDNGLLIVQNPNPTPKSNHRETEESYPFSRFDDEECTISHVYPTGSPNFLAILGGPAFAPEWARPHTISPHWWKPGRKQRSIRVFAYSAQQQGVVQTATWKVITENQRILYVDVWSPKRDGKKSRKITRLTGSPLLNNLENRLHSLDYSDGVDKAATELRIWNDVVPTRQSLWTLPRKRDKTHDDDYPPTGQFLPLFQDENTNAQLTPFGQLR